MLIQASSEWFFIVNDSPGRLILAVLTEHKPEYGVFYEDVSTSSGPRVGRKLPPCTHPQFGDSENGEDPLFECFDLTPFLITPESSCTVNRYYFAVRYEHNAVYTSFPTGKVLLVEVTQDSISIRQDGVTVVI